MKNCKLFKRSFTDKGIGYTFNNEVDYDFYKKSKNNEVLRKVLKVNEENNILNMRKAGSKHALRVLLENSLEEVENIDESAENKKPTSVEVTLHNPKEPANLRSNSFKVPLGYSTTVYISPQARVIDESGHNLLEDQRGCRLSGENQDLDIFQVYTQGGCILECLIRQAHQRCGCYPWNYVVTEVN